MGCGTILERDPSEEAGHNLEAGPGTKFIFGNQCSGGEKCYRQKLPGTTSSVCGFATTQSPDPTTTSADPGSHSTAKGPNPTTSASNTGSHTSQGPHPTTTASDPGSHSTAKGPDSPTRASNQDSHTTKGTNTHRWTGPWFRWER